MSDVVELLVVSPTGARRDDWPGPQRSVEPTAGAIRAALDSTCAEAVLCLDSRLALPEPGLIQRLLEGPADAWHAGLRLGLDGEPRMFDHVAPLWMLNAPVAPDVEATSWRLSLRSLLVRSTVGRQLGGPADGFDSLEGSGLELGLRWIRSGALVRHVPGLATRVLDDHPALTEADGLRLVARHHGQGWAAWALHRALLTGEVRAIEACRLARTVRSTKTVHAEPFRRPGRPPGDTDRSVSVVVPTLDRYPYLETLLHQLAAQRVPPKEVIVVDQTPLERRRRDLADIEPNLPVQVIELPRPGQCTARNAALGCATGELVLFLDDDDEIGPDLIADHLRRLAPGIDASCGGVDDATAGPPPEGFRHRRVSDVFPTNNTMVRRAALAGTGLFDPAYDRGARADHDLGMRLHISGALLVYDPSVLVFHHHAGAGGLRIHGSRAVTRAGARATLLTRHLPSVTEQYLGLRYFTERQNREAAAIRLMATLSGDGPRPRRVARAALQLLLLPWTALASARSRRDAARLLDDRPVVPTLPDTSAGSPS